MSFSAAAALEVCAAATALEVCAAAAALEVCAAAAALEVCAVAAALGLCTATPGVSDATAAVPSKIRCCKCSARAFPSLFNPKYESGSSSEATFPHARVLITLALLCANQFIACICMGACGTCCSFQTSILVVRLSCIAVLNDKQI